MTFIYISISLKSSNIPENKSQVFERRTAQLHNDFCVWKFKDAPVAPHSILEIAQIVSPISSRQLLLSSFEVHDCFLETLF